MSKTISVAPHMHIAFRLNLDLRHEEASALLDILMEYRAAHPTVVPELDGIIESIDQQQRMALDDVNPNPD